MKHRAQAMLISILMITAASLAIGLAIASIGSSEVAMSVSAKQSSQAYRLAETCMENTLMRMARSEMTAPAPFTNELGNCTINVSGSGNGPYQITSTGVVGKAYRKIGATVNISIGDEHNGQLNITSYQESY